MPDRDVAFIRDVFHYQYATIIAKSALAASDGESSLKLRGDKKFHDSIPPLLPSAAATTAQVHSTKTIWTGTERQRSAISDWCWSKEGREDA
jgi:hypothetical protein